MKQEPWTYKKAFDEALKELQDKAVGEYKKLQKSTRKADLILTNIRDRKHK